MTRNHRAARHIVGMIVLAVSLAQTQSLYWIESTFSSPSLKRSTLSGSNVQTLTLPSGSLPQGLAYDTRSDSVYWVELAFAGAHINVASPSPSAPHAVYSDGSVLRDIEVDTAAREMYWTATNLVAGSRILRANLDGSFPETLVAWSPGGLETPRGIALDIAGGMMYWADFNAGTIRRANLNGTAQEDVLTALQGPVALRLDLAAGKMYWTEANGHAIKRAGLNGSGVELLASTTATPNFLDLDIPGGKMYWTEIGTPAIRMADLDGTNAGTLPVVVDNPAGIMVVRTGATGVSPTLADLPHEYALMQNFPNPFNPSTTIRYDLPVAGDISLRVYDVLGQEIAVLAEGHADAGRYGVVWNAERAASGVYFVWIRSGSYTQVRRMLLLR